MGESTGHLMTLRRVWWSFRSWPAWVQVAAWLLAWPVLVALVIAARARGPAGRLAALIVLVAGGMFWFGALTTTDTDDTTAAAQTASAPPAARTARSSRGPAPTPGRSTAPAPATPPAPAPDTAEPRAPEGIPEGLQPAVVEHIVDGDTIWARVDRAVAGETLPEHATSKIRLLEVDTPESTIEHECGGQEASAFLAGKIPVGTLVHLQADTEDTDRYGRFLRYVWLDDGRLLNRMIVRHGYGEAVLYEPNDLHWERMQAAERRARDRGAGIWGDLCGTETGARSGPQPAPAPEQAQSGCHPSYDPCVPVTSDVDCAGGAGNGPAYTGRVDVIGPDDYDLDVDGDGVACDRG